jgi:hypothetical protein
VTAFITNPEGRIDGIVLSDGTTAHSGPEFFANVPALKRGDRLTLKGPGAVFPQGKTMRIQSLESSTGRTFIAVEDRGGPPAPRGPRPPRP